MTTADITLYALIWGGAFILFLMIAACVWAVRRNGTPKHAIPEWLQSQADYRAMTRPIPEVRHVICNVRFPINH